jgi:Transcriptional regulatory protein, C terminal
MKWLMVVSTDGDMASRVRRMGNDCGIGSVEWVRDPEQLRVLHPVEDDLAQLAGLVLDLSSSIPADKGASHAEQSNEQTYPHTDLAWRLATLLATARGYKEIPLIIVGVWDDLESAVRACRLNALGWISPSASETFWCMALRRLIEVKASGSSAHAVAARTNGAGNDKDKHRRVRIGPRMLLDGPACVLRRGHEAIPLTARELALLELLVDAPACYHCPREIARCLTPPGEWEVDKHSVEQAISRLRRKLGESARRPRLLLCKRGVGYGLFPVAAETPRKHKANLSLR